MKKRVMLLFCVVFFWREENQSTGDNVNKYNRICQNTGLRLCDLWYKIKEEDNEKETIKRTDTVGQILV